MSFKMIKVHTATHLALKIGAFNRGITLQDHLAKIANDLVNGEVFDVDSHSTSMLEAVRDDINNELAYRDYKHSDRKSKRYLQKDKMFDRAKVTINFVDKKSQGKDNENNH